MNSTLRPDTSQPFFFFIKVTFRGKRVAFSIFGKISSLNGEPEAGVILKAKGLAPPGKLRQDRGQSYKYFYFFGQTNKLTLNLKEYGHCFC